MKARPRRIENMVAEWITRLSVSKGYEPVERVPVIGRTGPDLTINGLGLVIDVKSRLEVPQSVLIDGPMGMIEMDGLIGVRLDCYELLFDRLIEPNTFRRPSKIVKDYWLHMDEWKQQHYPKGITTLVLHKPGRHVGGSTFLIHSDERNKLYGK